MARTSRALVKRLPRHGGEFTAYKRRSSAILDFANNIQFFNDR